MVENGRPQHLSPAQQRTITALLTERDVRSAARAAGVGETTIYRWLRENTAFREALHQAQREVFDESTRVLARLQTAAVAVLASVMANPNAQDGAKVSAAKAILDAGEKRIATADLGARLDEMEATLKELGAL